MPMTRILHVVSSLGTGSGVMSVLMSYHRAVDKTKLQFDYLSFRQTTDTYEQEISSLGGRIYHCSRPALSKNFFDEIECFFADHAGEYEIIHCHPIYASAVFAPAAKRHGVRHVIQHSHSTKRSDNPVSALRSLAIQLLLGRRATDYVACSEEAKKLFFWVRPEQVYLMRNAIDFERFRFSGEKRAEIRRLFEIGTQDTVLGHVGRFSKEKNHFFLLEVFRAYRKTDPSAWLLLVGDGVLLEQVKKRAEQLGISDHVIFAGRQSCVSAYMSAMDYFLLPSKFEGFGTVLIEAQASGLPCMASTKVPEAVKLTETLQFQPLHFGSETWASRIAPIKTESERMQSGSVPQSEFEIHSAAKRLEEYYRTLAQNREAIIR